MHDVAGKESNAELIFEHSHTVCTETVAQMVGHESVEIPAHLLEQFRSAEARDTLKEHLEEKFGRVVLDFQEGTLIAYALRVCSQCQREDINSNQNY